jgi:hypothetical protein
MDRIRQWWLYLLTEVSSLIFSLISVYYAAYYTQPPYADGGRGGAGGVILAFAILFLRRDYGADLFEEMTKGDLEKLRKEIKVFKRGPPFPSISDENFHIARRHIIAIITRMEVAADGQQAQNWSLAVASCIGTLFWGFGDKAAEWLKLHYAKPSSGLLLLLALVLLFSLCRLGWHFFTEPKKLR